MPKSSIQLNSSQSESIPDVPVHHDYEIYWNYRLNGLTYKLVGGPTIDKTFKSFDEVITEICIEELSIPEIHIIPSPRLQAFIFKTDPYGAR